VVDLPCGPETGYLPTIEALDALVPRPAGLLLASPANPTGTMMSAQLLADIAQWCDRNDVRLISDEIYHGLSFGEPAACARSFSDTAFVVNSFSKYYSMTGWRLGWMLAPPETVEVLDRLAGNVALCPPTISQYGAFAAFDSDDEALANLDRYRANRQLMMEALPAMGITRFAPPDGAFYIYADVSDFTSDSVAFCASLLHDTGVAITPGVDFDPIDGHGYVRLCFAGWEHDIAGALEAMSGWLRR
jgi:aspartate/methionine/tyrosine aminotransferase